MYVTIDSNVANIPQLIASKIGQSSIRWCSDLNVCDAFTELRNNGGKIDSNQNAMQVYFNTPISMSTDVEEYTMPPNTIHFVYLDYAVNTYALRMILNNIKKLRNVIIITNGSSYSYGQYVLTVGNCTLDDIADVISGIIVVHIRENRTVDERELVALICGETCDSTTCRATESKNTIFITSWIRNASIMVKYQTVMNARFNFFALLPILSDILVDDGFNVANVLISKVFRVVCRNVGSEVIYNTDCKRYGISVST
nr:hypothetical protein NNONMNKP_00030 [Oryctes rhinoceros nudivirus]WDA64980.2 hypothetical protein NFEMFJFI_00029 [Oryctes rhinoceros nudivirus]WDA65097.2 hypothetical protein GJFDDEIJ_00028 [Oryctes rhinoceros nudivirus]